MPLIPGHRKNSNDAAIPLFDVANLIIKWVSQFQLRMLLC
jgi:hypothetical protein